MFPYYQTLFTVASVIAPAFAVSSVAGSLKTNLWREVSASDKTFTDSWMFSATAASRSACALRCTDNDAGVIFTFTTSSGECRCHSSFMMSESTSSTVSGTEVFAKADFWLGLPCTNNNDCRATMSECFDNVCLCTPGYYYSISLNYCVPSCATSDLQTTFLRYPDTGIGGNNLYGGTKGSTQECLDWCAADSNCLTVEHQRSNHYCIVAGVTPLQAAEKDWNGLDLYQRQCA